MRAKCLGMRSNSTEQVFAVESTARMFGHKGEFPGNLHSIPNLTSYITIQSHLTHIFHPPIQCTMRSLLYVLFFVGLSINALAAPILQGGSRATGPTNNVRNIATEKGQNKPRTTINNESNKGGVLEFDIGDVPLRLPGGEPDKIAHVPK
ncbi:hypothetical protein B0T10DRAFT_575723 [Thelonectria olida]|uniref:Uncharacterized protein n=1 Tax=Thelonectria olida TaxID=1576542 RepID=A0A9P9ANN5_9HYPO|nr:hypothetical protein B0T10DRAFT_575723 [Thelonectria olida]